ncbi:MAG TPA: aldehyde dehydrogenase family protein, partial [Reyranella sp.]|nr:aldehyde dehydrogenase family protein [Reyranella sp.]
MTNDHPYPRIGLFIGGQWIHDRAPHTDVRNPADETPLAPVPKASTADLDAALSAAAEGFRRWRATSPEERAAVLRKAVQLMRKRTDSIATTISLELGKPIADSRAEVQRSCTMIEWDAAEAQRLYGRILPSAPGSQHMVLRQPVGPVAAFTPW